ncbi:hypothetical protein EYB25_007912 [Talaromyces marneffei]|nr:hypothetical protein EYB25_007912 [Talaromyces marneffei]
MASILSHFGRLFSFGTEHTKEIVPSLDPRKLLHFLGLQLGLLKPVTAHKVFLVNNSPILSILVHEKIFEVGNEGIESLESTLREELSTIEAPGQRIDGLPKLNVPERPTPGTEKLTTGGEAQNIHNFFKASEPAELIPEAVESSSDAEEQEDNLSENGEYDDISGLTSCWTQAASILDKVLYAGDQPAFANFANFNFEPESADPIPPEYEAATEFLHAALVQFPIPPSPTQSRVNACHNTQEDPPGFVPPPLTEESLNNNVQALRPLIAVPSHPYPYMKNPEHPDPESMPNDQYGAPLECWDCCGDCEVYPIANGSRIWRVHNWFEKYFTHHDMYWGDFGKNPSHPSLKHPEPGPDDEDTGPMIVGKRQHDEDFLLGAEGVDDFLHYRFVYFNEPEDVHQDICTLLVQYMQLGERVDKPDLNLSYYYGERSNAILAEYEPRFLPNVGFSYEGNKLQVLQYPGIDDMTRPIWEARGCPVPMQADRHTRMEYAKREYDRQWTMYRAQDDARQRYVQQVMEAARYEYIQRRLLA